MLEGAEGAEGAVLVAVALATGFDAWEGPVGGGRARIFFTLPGTAGVC
jgi:hypothetical protein